MSAIGAALRSRLESRDQAGMSLVELLVGIALFGVLGTLLLGLGLSTARVTDRTKSVTEVTEEARHALERLTRELRQANKLTAAQMVGDNAIAITAEIDFNGNGQIEATSLDPEVVTYRWDSASEALTLTANVEGQPETHPVLAGRVTNFSVSLWSSRWDYDTGAPAGTTWREIDAAGSPVGDGDGKPDGCATVPADPRFCASQVDELALIDRLQISVTVEQDGNAYTYKTEVHLRNARAS